MAFETTKLDYDDRQEIAVQMTKRLIDKQLIDEADEVKTQEIINVLLSKNNLRRKL